MTSHHWGEAAAVLGRTVAACVLVAALGIAMFIALARRLAKAPRVILRLCTGPVSRSIGLVADGLRLGCGEREHCGQAIGHLLAGDRCPPQLGDAVLELSELGPVTCGVGGSPVRAVDGGNWVSMYSEQGYRLTDSIPSCPDGSPARACRP